NTVLSLATTQGLELILTLFAIMIWGNGKFPKYGFRKPEIRQGEKKCKTGWLLIFLTAPILGIITSITILGLGGTGNPMIKQLSFPQIVLFVWISSSIIEEVFTRGFLQGHLSVLSGSYFKLSIFRIEIPVLISAVFFSCMHLVLLLADVDIITIVTILLFTFSIGLMAGHFRSKTGSLIPAIAVHILANIGGLIGGIIFTFVNFLISGKLPTIG
ncbi:MAG: CPBP family intramembrane glutamic endopeptidase, partial [candidate division Zixibacteria bacterium]|nr:CPBP family intramembrane glutamic endopeptidase [candidate division Zixibacteria bacterium]